MTGPQDQDGADRLAGLRVFFARHVAARGGARDPRVERAFAAVPREAFAGPGPWSVLVLGPWRQGSPAYIETPDADPVHLFQDVLVALDATRGINIGEPSLHAHCLDALAPRPGDTVVQVGAGSGYYTAILAELVGHGGRVHAFEIDEGLAARAAANLALWPQASVEARSGAVGGLPPADAVYVNAGLSRPERGWIEALRPGGRLLFPLQEAGGRGGMLLVGRPGPDSPRPDSPQPDSPLEPGAARTGSAWPARFVTRAGFIACQAPQDAEAGARLTQAFARGAIETVRSLRFGGRPDGTCWHDGGDWWLSTAEP